MVGYTSCQHAGRCVRPPAGRLVGHVATGGAAPREQRPDEEDRGGGKARCAGRLSAHEDQPGPTSSGCPWAHFFAALWNVGELGSRLRLGLRLRKIEPPMSLGSGYFGTPLARIQAAAFRDCWNSCSSVLVELAWLVELVWLLELPWLAPPQPAGSPARSSAAAIAPMVGKGRCLSRRRRITARPSSAPPRYPRSD